MNSNKNQIFLAVNINTEDSKKKKKRGKISVASEHSINLLVGSFIFTIFTINNASTLFFKL